MRLSWLQALLAASVLLVRSPSMWPAAGAQVDFDALTHADRAIERRRRSSHPLARRAGNQTQRPVGCLAWATARSGHPKYGQAHPRRRVALARGGRRFWKEPTTVGLESGARRRAWLGRGRESLLRATSEHILGLGVLREGTSCERHVQHMTAEAQVQRRVLLCSVLSPLREECTDWTLRRGNAKRYAFGTAFARSRSVHKDSKAEPSIESGSDISSISRATPPTAMRIDEQPRHQSHVAVEASSSSSEPIPS